MNGLPYPLFATSHRPWWIWLVVIGVVGAIVIYGRTRQGNLPSFRSDGRSVTLRTVFPSSAEATRRLIKTIPSLKRHRVEASTDRQILVATDLVWFRLTQVGEEGNIQWRIEQQPKMSWLSWVPQLKGGMLLEDLERKLRMGLK